MRKIALIAVPMAIVASPAAAQDSTGTVDITGSVAGRCLFTTPSGLIELGELALGGSDSNAGRLDAGVVNGESETLIGWCNSTAAGMYVVIGINAVLGFVIPGIAWQAHLGGLLTGAACAAAIAHLGRRRSPLTPPNRSIHWAGLIGILVVLVVVAAAKYAVSG